VSTTISVYVPCGSIEAYQKADGWSEFTNYLPIDFPSPDNVTVLEQNNVLEISWQNTDALNYEIYRNNELLTTISEITYTDSNLFNGINYCYKIKAIYRQLLRRI
jgi:hypothetical protein